MAENNIDVSQKAWVNTGNMFGNIEGDLHIGTIDNRIPSILADYIPEIAILLLNEDLESYSSDIITPPKIEKKIDYNKIKSFKISITDSVKYTLDLDDVIQIVEATDKWSAKKLQWRVVKLYHEISWKNDDVIEYSDDIYCALKNRLREIYITSKNKRKNIREEELDLSLDILICKYFIECKIFIKSPQDDS